MAAGRGPVSAAAAGEGGWTGFREVRAVLVRARALLAVATLVAGWALGMTQAAASPTPITTPGVTRLAGPDRYATAAALSAATWAAPVPVAYVSTGADFPDALSGGTAAARAGGPLLLVRPTMVPAPVALELTRLRPARIVILGGTGVVSSAVQTALAAFAPTVSRIAGANRYATSGLVARAAFTAPVPVAYLATGTGFADALSGAAAAAHEGGPILLTSPSVLPTETGAALTALRPKRIVIVGGSGAVSETVAAALDRYTAGAVSRLAGGTRYDTAATVATTVFATARSVVLATGEDFPDAVAGIPSASVNDAPLLLSGPYCVTNATRAAHHALGSTRTLVLGGSGVVADKAAGFVTCIQRLGIVDSGYALSGDGRLVAFDSSSSTLVGRDTNGVGDVFVTDTLARQTSRVSTASDGTQADAPSSLPAISADGRFVGFSSTASNLVPDDTNGLSDVFVKDRRSGITTRVSTAGDGGQGNGASTSEGSALSGDGRFVVFSSTASNLVAGDTNGGSDVFVKDLRTGATTRVSTLTGGPQLANGAPGGVQSTGGSISAEGRYVAFRSNSVALTGHRDPLGGTRFEVFSKDRVTDVTTQVSTASDGTPSDRASVGGVSSADGRFVAFESLSSNLVAGDTNGAWDSFVKDRASGRTIRVSTASDGSEGNATAATPDIGPLGTPSISADGRYVSFATDASTLVTGDTGTCDQSPRGGPVANCADVFVKDTLTGDTTRVSTAADGTPGVGDSTSHGSALSADGRFVVFRSLASNLAPGSDPGLPAVFVVQVR